MGGEDSGVTRQLPQPRVARSGAFLANTSCQVLSLFNPILATALVQTLAEKPSLRALTLEIVTLQLKLRMPPGITYAFIKTGYVVTKENAATFSPAELEDWRRLQMEYFALAARQTN